jgi:hypothetical protein
MSDEKEITITTTADGSFKINTGNGIHDASIRHDGGADIVTFGKEEARNVEAQRIKPHQSFQQVEGTFETTFGGKTRVRGVETHTIERGGDGFNLLSGITDLAGRPESDLSKVKAAPGQYKASFGGTEATIDVLMRSGLIRTRVTADWKRLVWSRSSAS